MVSVGRLVILFCLFDEQACFFILLKFTIADFEEWEQKHGRIPEGGVVFVRSGWDKNYPTRELYLGSKSNNWMTDFHFPGFDKDAATWLGEQRYSY